MIYTQSNKSAINLFNKYIITLCFHLKARDVFPLATSEEDCIRMASFKNVMRLVQLPRLSFDNLYTYYTNMTTEEVIQVINTIINTKKRMYSTIQQNGKH